MAQSLLDLKQQRISDPSAVTRTAGYPDREFLDHMLRGARRSVHLMLADDGARSAAVLLKALSQAPLSPAVTVRVLCAAETGETGETTGGAHTSWEGHPEVRNPRLNVRVSEHGLREALIIDGAVALVRTGSDPHASAALINDPPSVRTLDLLFTSAYARGSSPIPHRQLPRRSPQDLSRRVLELLCKGMNDATAASRLNVSLRTYRRYVAQLMREFNASSRFQAGVRAVELGVLSAASPPGQAPGQASGGAISGRRRVAAAMAGS